MPNALMKGWMHWAACLRGFVLAAAMAWMLPGCGLNAAQRSAAVQFGTAAADLGAIAGEEFRQSRFDVIAMNTQRRALGDATVDPERLDAYFTMEDVSARVEACAALQRYGVLLVQLAAGAEEAAVQAAGQRLVASLGRLKSAGQIEISDEKLGAIGKAVAAVGGMAVEDMRARALREVTDASGPAVRRLGRLIRRDFDPGGEHWSAGYEAAAVKLEERVKNVRVDLGGPAPGERAARASMEVALVQAESMAAQNRARFAEVGGRIVAAVDAMALAEQDMRGVLAAPGLGLDDLDPFSDRVAELISTYRILRE